MTAYTQQQVDADWAAAMRDPTRTPGSTIRFRIAHEHVLAMIPAGTGDEAVLLVTEVCPRCDGEHTVDDRLAQTVTYCESCNDGGDADEPGIVTRRVTAGELRSGHEECLSSLEGIQVVEAAS